ncbi:uncharacterized protein LOC116614928 isoform X1 [Nematostella vectensis]|uniref:uncharacterized protein LOC116614928 isoform X1 n=1 Tax=Nematostella vectensis TaxID=45351 RepID=UPI00138FDC52|nr:uncharacterized protein LOC116614928 isoform X1 [Nematostella vectensis]
MKTTNWMRLDALVFVCFAVVTFSVMKYGKTECQDRKEPTFESLLESHRFPGKKILSEGMAFRKTKVLTPLDCLDVCLRTGDLCASFSYRKSWNTRRNIKQYRCVIYRSIDNSDLMLTYATNFTYYNISYAMISEILRNTSSCETSSASQSQSNPSGR